MVASKTVYYNLLHFKMTYLEVGWKVLRNFLMTPFAGRLSADFRSFLLELLPN